MVVTRLAGLLALAGVNVVLLAIGIVAIELCFGSWFEPYMPPRSAILDRTATYRQALYDPPSVVTYVRDRFGLRGVRGRLEDVGMVTLGGSTTDQRFITEGETWQDVISSLTGTVIANAGIDGMSSNGHVLAVEEWLHKIPGLKARYYLHFIGVNDSWLPAIMVPPDRPGTSSLITRIRLRSAIVDAIGHGWDLIRGAEQVRHGHIVPHELDDVEPVKAVVDRR